MPVISQSNGYLFIATPRSGATAIVQLFQKHSGGVTIPSETVENDGRVLVDSKHGRLSLSVIPGHLYGNKVRA